MSNIQRELPRRNFSQKNNNNPHFLNRETEGQLRVSAQNAAAIPEKRVGECGGVGGGGPWGVFKSEILQGNVKENHMMSSQRSTNTNRCSLKIAPKLQSVVIMGRQKKSFHAHNKKKKKISLCLQCLTISAGNQLVPLSGSGRKKDGGPV